jgi:hypothetical protein
MTQSAQVLTMLIIDDDERYVDALFRDGQRCQIQLRHAASLEQGQRIFEGAEGGLISGIILDVECYRLASQETPDSSFIIAATKYFNEKAADLPLVAITGVQPLYDRYSRDFAGIWQVYRKGRDEAAMLDYLKEKAGELAWVKLVHRYPEVFAIVAGELGGDARGELLDCLANMEASSLPRIRGNLANLRSLQEKIYLALNRLDPLMVPAQFIQGRQGESGKSCVDVGRILEHLKGGYQPQTQRNTGKVYLHYRSILYRYSEMIYKVASDGIHAIDEGGAFRPTAYTVQAATFALLDLLLWFAGVVQGKRESDIGCTVKQ